MAKNIFKRDTSLPRMSGKKITAEIAQKFPPVCCDTGVFTAESKSYTVPGTGHTVAIPTSAAAQKQYAKGRRKWLLIGLIAGLFILALIYSFFFFNLNNNLWNLAVGGTQIGQYVIPAAAVILGILGALTGYKSASNALLPVKISNYDRANGTMAIRYKNKDVAKKTLAGMKGESSPAPAVETDEPVIEETPIMTEQVEEVTEMVREEVVVEDVAEVVPDTPSITEKVETTLDDLDADALSHDYGTAPKKAASSWAELDDLTGDLPADSVG